MARSLPVCDRHTAIIWALVLIGLAPALYLHLIHAINYDIAWLAIAAERLLQGGSMLRDAYEPNPPLSIIFMMPPVLLSWITPLPLYICTTLYSTIIIFGSTLLCHALLRRLDFLDRHDVNIFCAAYLCAMIVFPSIDYGERDHLVLAGVMPFMLWQIAFTFKRPLPPRLTSAILIVGPLFVLLKPHFGLLPTLLLLHRTIIQRRLFSIIRDPDFIALAVGVVIYITVTLLFFNDYVTQILPAVLSIYIGMRETGLFELTAFYAAMVAVFAFLYIFLPVEPRRRYFVLFLFAAALCCLVPYTVQGKNYWYHLVPALAVYYTALALMARTVLAHYIPRALPLQSVLLAILLVAGAYGFMPLNTNIPTMPPSVPCP
ncbi:MAG: hypothetical protein KKA05_00110 [Alphaproteobacteria bacterium]|nr:hypothetical protein [Alphaproteobacteria bacterium]